MMKKETQIYCGESLAYNTERQKVANMHKSF